MLELVPPEVRELWLEQRKGSVTIQEFGNEIQFAFGGLHGAHMTKKRVKKVKLLDVTSNVSKHYFDLKCTWSSNRKI